MAGVYWIGANGETYMKGDGFNGGKVTEWFAPLQSPQNLGYTRIDDPVNPTGWTPGGAASSPAPSSGGGGTPGPVFNQAGAENTQRTINELPGLMQAAIEAEQQRYNNTVGQYNAQEGTQRKTYEGSTVTNQQNYDSNFMDSIRAGIKGLGGLMALLRGTGAAGGSAEDQVRDTVGGVTANDVRTGADTQKENQGALDSSLAAFLTELGGKRRQSEDTLENNRRAIQRDSDTQLQDLFGKMAGFYGDVGNTAASNDWMNRAGSLTPAIAQNSRTQVSPYDATPVVVQAPELAAFKTPTQPSVTTSADGQVGSGIFTMTDPRRRRESQAAPVGV